MSNNRYNARALPVISRDTSYTEEPYNGEMPAWYNEFVKNLEVQSTKSQRSIYDQITSILGNSKSKFSSVDEVVEDLKHRTGLKAFLQAKQANMSEPKIFSEIPQMKIFIDNFISDRPGTSIESVVHELLRIDTIRDKLPSKIDIDDDVKAYINVRIGESKERSTPDVNNVNMNLGKVEPSNDIDVDNPFQSCEPTKY